MACRRNCTSTVNLCDSALQCVQFQQDSGPDCAGIADGYSRVQVNALGQLEICSNVGGVCECTVVGGEGAGVSTVTVVNQTIVHNDGDGVETIIDICDLITAAYATTPWTTLPLAAGWAAEAGQQAPEYRCLCTGEVQLRGCVTGTVTNGEVSDTVATIPASQSGNGCRPAAAVLFPGGCAPIEIGADGVISTSQIATPDNRCLNGMEFFV